jgi:UDP-2,4-diacetamido-2,4,6-trideoxy-beta-L-altropyranose hydrolase
MVIVFRADASLQIGTGHVMRCLALADALYERNAQSIFICRPHVGHLLDLIAHRGHQALTLPALKEVTSLNSIGTNYADWLVTDWETDAVETQNVLTSIGAKSVDWLVVDHYALDHLWERALRTNTRKIMVIDDLADRLHDCELLLDQNLGRTSEDYSGLLSPKTNTCIGPHYALLRHEFAELRPQSLARRAQIPQLKQLLITMGGVDKDNVTGQVLDALQTCTLPPDLNIKVVLGPYAPWLTKVQLQAESMHCSTQVLVGVNNMAKLMVECDLCIGAAGSTSWERCCLGVPTIQLVLAANQKGIADALVRSGATRSADISSLPSVLNELMSVSSAECLSAMTNAAAQITTGLGAAKIAKCILNFKHENLTTLL